MRIIAMNQENIPVHHLGLAAIPCYTSTGMLCGGRVLYDKNYCGTQSGFPPCGRSYIEAEQRGHQRRPLFAVWIPALQHSLLHVCPLSNNEHQLNCQWRLGVGRQFLSHYRPQEVEALCDAPIGDMTVSRGSEDLPNNLFSSSISSEKVIFLVFSWSDLLWK